jgi:elongation factor 2 kinase
LQHVSCLLTSTNVSFSLQKAAAKAIAEEDVWKQHNIPSIPAELAIRHLYNPETDTWTSEETIVKIQSTSFANGAMRHCFRMKKVATPPQSANNHRFHSYGWTRASNYVAKAYMIAQKLPDGSARYEVDCSDAAKRAVRNDVILQHEANKWANRFNNQHPPKSISFLRAYALEFPNRIGSPWFAVERYVAGKDTYGAGFFKHNTNSGYVDKELRRTTPQVFSAFTFYASQGHRLVTDIQGVGDLYTDPQVLSSDYRFGEGDLGIRGMALFFHSFRHCSFSDLMGIPIFPLSKNEIKHQAKYNEDDLTESDGEDDGEDECAGLLRMEANRFRRKSALLLPSDLEIFKPQEEQATVKRSNVAMSRQEIRQSIRASKRALETHPTLTRSKSDVDEVNQSLVLATIDSKFDHKVFHRKSSGELRERTAEQRRGSYRTDIIPSQPMIPCEETKSNLGKVHFQLACLHGMGRFPEMMDNDDSIDISSIVFHLAHACSLRNVPACLSLGRARAGLDTSVSPLLRDRVPIDMDAAKELFLRAMNSENSSARPKAAACCLLLQLLNEEANVKVSEKVHVLEQAIRLLEIADKEDQELKEHLSRVKVDHVETCQEHRIGDKVEANYSNEGTYYNAVITAIDDSECAIIVQYDDDGSFETHSKSNIRYRIPMTATRDCGGPTTSDNFFDENENEDVTCIMEDYTLKAELADLKIINGELKEAACLLEEAANSAMNAGKMKFAAECSLKSSNLTSSR